MKEIVLMLTGHEQQAFDEQMRVLSHAYGLSGTAAVVLEALRRQANPVGREANPVEVG